MKRFAILISLVVWTTSLSLSASAIDDELATARQAQDGTGAVEEDQSASQAANGLAPAVLTLGLGSGLFDCASDVFARATIRLDPVCRILLDAGCLIHESFWAFHGGCGLSLGTPAARGALRIYGGPLVEFYVPDAIMSEGLQACFGLYGHGGVQFPMNDICSLYFEFGGGKVLSAYKSSHFGDGAFIRGGLSLAF
jgi:hypothetical protein